MKEKKGFTLFQNCIVVGIVGLLLLLAFNSFRDESPRTATVKSASVTVLKYSGGVLVGTWTNIIYINYRAYGVLQFADFQGNSVRIAGDYVVLNAPPMSNAE